jgi:hypothetical protein
MTILAAILRMASYSQNRCISTIFLDLALIYRLYPLFDRPKQVGVTVPEPLHACINQGGEE